MSDGWWVDSGELDKDQREVVAFPANGRYLVLGPPGSGKTNLLLLRAKFLSRVGHLHIAVLMFTRSLREFLARGSATYNFPVDRLNTIMKWGLDLLRQHSMPVDGLTEDSGLRFEQKRDLLIERLNDLLAQKPTLAGSYDCILVDEVQDCLQAEIDIFLKFARNVFFVGDERQKIYKTGSVLQHIESLAQAKRLQFHYRSGRKIWQVADRIGADAGFDPMLPSCKYPEDKDASTVEVVHGADLKDQCRNLVMRLDPQRKAYPEELLGVVCLRKTDVATVRTILKQSPLAPYILDDLSATTGSRQIFVCNIHNAKGLEFRCLHLLGMDHLHEFPLPLRHQIAYMGVTRAHSSLTAYHSGSMLGYVDAALHAPDPEPETPSLDDLFPRRRKL
jgi:hypothetical protein